MIKSLNVKGLNNKSDFNLELEFNADLNIFTGKNGSGKTTVLKLLWYMNGGFFSQLIAEVPFYYVELQTSDNTVSIERTKKDTKRGNTYKFKLDDQEVSLNEDNINGDYRQFRSTKLFDTKLVGNNPSIFFPTFRRIEGGFTVDRNRYNDPFASRYGLKEALSELSQNLSAPAHKFVASISTDDLVSLLTTESAKINEQINSLQKSQSDSIIDKIKKRSGNDVEILESIQADIERTDRIRQNLSKPFTVLSELLSNIFQHKGITLGKHLTIGDISNAISSDKLSAGEKQMLSFLCYNTFSKNNAIFIDEPELSLHPDWQRTLVSILLEQGNQNQFFMATHSPFIYSKFSDKEVIIAADKGELFV